MLQSLHIENFAIIDKLEVEFGSGFNVITGETGAGKTIVVQALNLVLGDRASSDLIRSGEERATVTARFLLKDVPKDFVDTLANMGIEAKDELIIHRVLSSATKGKIAINGAPATQQMLKDIAERLVDVSSQHEHQLLLNPASHCSIVDQFGSIEPIREEYNAAHHHYISLHDEVDRLRRGELEAKERLDFIKYQMQELKGAGLKIREDEELEAERSRLRHAVQLESKIRESEESLYGSAGSVVEVLGSVEQAISSCSQIDQTLTGLKETVSRVGSELSDVSRELKRYVEKLNADPDRLEAIHDRLHLIKELKRKHGGSIESCIEKLNSLETEIDNVERYDELLVEKEKVLENARIVRAQIADGLSKKRHIVASELTEKMEKELSGLGLGKTKFAVQLTNLPEEEWGTEGKDGVEFLISPNIGEELRPLAKIASGGELSRFMLAIKRVLADKTRLALTSIFDEVDSGIGGATAEIVGKKLREVASSRQVICITHLPQIACFGDDHFRVQKRVIKGRTLAQIESLDLKERVEELSRMLGGTKITEATRTHAEEMLERASV